MDEILKRDHGSTVTVRQNRLEKCQSVTKTILNENFTNEYFLDKDSNLLVLIWNDNRMMCIAFNQHGMILLKM